MAELLAPAGDPLKLKVAAHYGADAVYLGGSSFSLRAFAGNFGERDLKEAFRFLHGRGMKGYVTVNIFARNADFGALAEYLSLLEGMADGVLVTDPGLVDFAKSRAPGLNLHLSTQANTLNKYAAKFWADQGVCRIVLARELTLSEIREIRDFLPDACELEAFVHGAMCVSYSGRCLLSNYLQGRDSNRGECVQACRWKYKVSGLTALLTEAGRPDSCTIEEDGRGSYLLNSRDLNMIAHLRGMEDAGVCSFKIEGRMKSEYYVGAVVNAYRRVMDGRLSAGEGMEELEKTSHRAFATAYLLEEGNEQTLCPETSKPEQSHDFIAMVLEGGAGGFWAEQRNRFRKGEEAEILSSGDSHNRRFVVGEMRDEAGNLVEDAKLVRQRLWIPSPHPVTRYDMLRRARK